MPEASEDLGISAARLPIAATFAVLLSFAALFLREQRATILLAFGLLFVASYFTHKRFAPAAGTLWIVRCATGAAICLVSFSAGEDQMGFLIDPRFVNAVGEICAAELVLRCWMPPRQNPGSATILLTGIIYFAACNTIVDRTTFVLTPIFMVALSASLLSFRPTSNRTTPLSLFYALAMLVSAVLFGGGIHIAFHNYRYPLQNWAMELLRERVSTESNIMSSSPHLGSSAGDWQSVTRMLTLQGTGEFSHLRCMTFDSYQLGTWLPLGTQRLLTTIQPGRFFHHSAQPEVVVTRLQANDGMIVAPLGTPAIDLRSTDGLKWMADGSGPIVTLEPAPSTYSFAGETDGGVHPLEIPPNPEYRARLLAVNVKNKEAVVALARRIGEGHSTIDQKAIAIQMYLPANHHYSRTTRADPKDPVTGFLLSKQNADCEYFASSAVILLRCLKIPARYVIGFYAHEVEEDGITVVRLRDAHAWAEYWDGFNWKTLDATPADGKPSALKELPLLTLVVEWCQRQYQRFMKGDRFRNAILVLGAATIVALFLKYRPSFRKDKRLSSHSFAYTVRSAELEAIRWRFEKLCRDRGIDVSEGASWSVWLDEPAVRGMVNVELAKAFIENYTEARFSRQEQPDAVEKLGQLLSRLGA